MPKAFRDCVKNNGKVRTVKGKKYGCDKGEYRHICILDDQTFMGEILKKEKES